jgi:large subunit ribosomal protein L19
MNILREIENEIRPIERPLDFKIGDTVKVHYKIIEGNRERIQVYEGLVIAINNKGLGKTFTVRRVSYDVGVERIFPLYSTRIAKIDLVRRGKVRRSKLYFLRERKGKAATKIKERRQKITEKAAPAVPATPAAEVPPAE